MKHISDAPLQARLLALPTNIRLDWKGLPGPNTLADYENSELSAVKSFHNTGPSNVTDNLKEWELSQVKGWEQWLLSKGIRPTAF